VIVWTELLERVVIVNCDVILYISTRYSMMTHPERCLKGPIHSKLNCAV